MSSSVPKAILLHPDDNILVCVVQIREGDTVPIDGEPVVIKRDIGVGHKIARRGLNTGDKVYRYGAPIGSMVEAVVAGEHVHMHNMKSDYIPSHTRTKQDAHRSDSQ
jgi:(2R)-sulfolactate sulfo-lyase subunit alpha